jgi:cytosine/adenosine deaminase-related metal-dependent hydrolase
VCDRQDFRSDEDLLEAFRLVTEAPAAVTGLVSTPLCAGSPADFVILPVSSLAEAMALRPLDRVVFRKGTMVARGGHLIGGGP